jgi:hypothetical protein
MQESVSSSVSCLFWSSDFCFASVFGFAWSRPDILRQFRVRSCSSEKSLESRPVDGGEGFDLLSRTCCWLKFGLSAISSQALVDPRALGEVGGVMGVQSMSGNGRGRGSVAVGRPCLGVLLLGGVDSGVRGSFENEGSEPRTWLNV